MANNDNALVPQMVLEHIAYTIAAAGSRGNLPDWESMLNQLSNEDKAYCQSILEREDITDNEYAQHLDNWQAYITE